MGAHSGSKNFGNKDLLFTLDSKSPKSRQFDANILAPWVDAWTVGDTGSSTGMSQVDATNSRVEDENPYGALTCVWQAVDADTASNADGGWTTSTFDIDPDKMYRFSLWVRRTVGTAGSFYHGVYGKNSAGTNVGVYGRSNGSNYTNPYFQGGGWSGVGGAINEWRYVVGHVWPRGSGTGSVHPDSGIFKTDGTKVSSISDYVWRDDNSKATHRTYLYYNTDTTTTQQWWNPRVEPVEIPGAGTKTVSGYVPVKRVIKEGLGGRWNARKRASDSNGAVGLKKVRPTTSNGGGFNFGAGDDDKSIRFPLSGNFNKLEGTISAWVYPAGYSGSNGIFVNRDNTTTNSTNWLWIGSWGSGSYLYFRIGSDNSCCNNDLTLSGSNAPTTVMPVNKWTNVTCTWKSGGSSFIYINGVQKGTRSISSTVPSSNPTTHGRIGLGHDSGTTGSWNGQIDQFKIYGKQLSGTDVALNYTAEKHRYTSLIRSGS